MDFLERDRIGARLLDGLGEIARLVLFDRRGIGLSDPITDWSRCRWSSNGPTICRPSWKRSASISRSSISLGDYWGPARLFAARHPDALGALVLYEPTGPAFSVDLATPALPRRTQDDDDSPETDWIATDLSEPRRRSRLSGLVRDCWSGRCESCDRRPRLRAVLPNTSLPTLAASHPADRGSDPRVAAARQSDGFSAAAGSRLRPRSRTAGGSTCRVTDYHWLGRGRRLAARRDLGFVTGESRSAAGGAGTARSPVHGSRRLDGSGHDRLAMRGGRRSSTATTRRSRRRSRVTAVSWSRRPVTVCSQRSHPQIERCCAAERIHADLARDALKCADRRACLRRRTAWHRRRRYRRARCRACMALAGPGEIFVTASVPIAATGTEHRFDVVGDCELKGSARNLDDPSERPRTPAA